jgi:hypothetical protein
MAERPSGVQTRAREESGEAGSAEQRFAEELRAAQASGRRRPDFFIVGHAKCGTTALHQMLCSHPSIYMPEIKETQFLSRGPHIRTKHPRPVRPQTLEQYLALFEGVAPDVRAGEASTEYLRTPGTAARIAELCPEARIIALFREPASFLRSLHLQLLEVRNESERDFAKAMGLEEERRRGREIPAGSSWPPALLYSDHVRYVHQLREYHEHFGRERVLALIYDDFRRDNEAVLRGVLRFLDVDDSVKLQIGEANPTVRVRSRRLLDTMDAVTVGRTPAARAVKRGVKRLAPARLRRAALRRVKSVAVDTAPSAPDAAFMQELRRRFKGEVVAAGEYLQRDLVTLWGYDETE